MLGKKCQFLDQLSFYIFSHNQYHIFRKLAGIMKIDLVRYGEIVDILIVSVHG